MLIERSISVFQSQKVRTQHEPPNETWPQGRAVTTPEEWRVEAILPDGAIEQSSFWGHQAKERAEEYKAWRESTLMAMP